MTLLLQTEGHVKARNARRGQARAKQLLKVLDSALDTALDAALDEAIEEAVRKMQAAAVYDALTAAGVAAAGALSGPGRPGSPEVTMEAAAAASKHKQDCFKPNSVLTSAVGDTCTAKPARSVPDALRRQVREAFARQAQPAASALAKDLADSALHRDSTLEELRKFVPVEFLVAWAAWTTASALVSPNRVTDAVRWAVWGLYSLAAFLYVLWQLHESRLEEECEDCPDEQVGEDEVDLLEEGDRTSQTAETAATPVPLDGRRTIESNGFHGSNGALTVPLLLSSCSTNSPAQGPECREVASRGPAFMHVAQSAGSGGSVARRRSTSLWPAPPASPSNTQLAVQAAVSAVAFMLLSAAMDDFYLQPRPVLWGVLALAPLFPLLAQCLRPTGVQR